MIQVSYVILAILFAASSIIFFVGSGFNFSGSIFDVLDRGGGSSTGDQVKKAEKKVKRDPANQRAWLQLTRARYFTATTGDNYNQQTGAFTDKAKDELRSTVRAWERYLALKPKKPAANVASLVVRAYGLGLEDFDNAVKTQQIITAARPSSSAFAQLAQFAYAANNMRIGDNAADRAVELTPKKQRKFVSRQLKTVKKEALKVAAQKAVGQAGQQPGSY